MTNHIRRTLRIVISVALVASVGWFALPGTRQRLEGLTGENAAGGQLRALYHLGLQQFRPALQLAPEAVIDYHGAVTGAPGVNTFLQQEVDPAKRDRQLQMIQAAGFKWIRQQFPWFDIEVHAKGDYEDRRNEPFRAAWEKYDNIVDLAEKHGLQVIARLDAPPQWAHQGYADFGDFGPPADFKDYADYVEAVATHYKGRITYWQIWNEPNIFPEWGNQRANPEDYTKLLCLAHARLKQRDPKNVVIAAALSPTIGQDGGGYPGGGLSDLIFMQRMYQAGASACFDIAAAQGYGLFSGPEDQRTNPLMTNVARHMLIRDIMVRNGDERKPIWLAEANWNAPTGDPTVIAGYGMFGLASLEDQARFVPQLYERAKRDWPWVGMIAVWFFKPADDSERNQAKFYFRMLEPDFTPLPVYDAMRFYLTKLSDGRGGVKSVGGVGGVRTP